MLIKSNERSETALHTSEVLKLSSKQRQTLTNESQKSRYSQQKVAFSGRSNSHDQKRQHEYELDGGPDGDVEIKDDEDIVSINISELSRHEAEEFAAEHAAT